MEDFNVLQEISQALQQLLVSYQEQNSLSQALTNQNQTISAELQQLQKTNLKTTRDLKGVGEDQQKINARIAELTGQLASVQAPKRTIDLNKGVLAAAIICFAGMVWMGGAKIFDYNASKASVEQQVIKYFDDNYYLYDKSDYTQTKKGKYDEITPKSPASSK